MTTNLSGKNETKELDTLLGEFVASRTSWRFDGPEFEFWTSRIKNIIRRVYESNESAERLAEFDAACLFRRNPVVINRRNRANIEHYAQNSFEEILPRLEAHVRALRNDVFARAEVNAEREYFTSTNRPKVFIAHGGQSDARDFLELYLWRKGYRPIIIEELPSLGKSPDDKVDHYLEMCQFGVIFAELRRASVQDGVPHPRLNIVDELVRIKKTLNGRFVVLLEEGLSINSDEQVTYLVFSLQSLDKPCNFVLQELEAHAIRGRDELTGNAG